MAYLQVVQQFCDKYGLPSPNSLVASTDVTFRQLHALCVEAVQDLSNEKWQATKKRVTFTSVAAADQGSILTLFGSGYNQVQKDSLWDNTAVQRIFGPVSEQVWQMFQAAPASGPSYYFTIFDNHLWVNPVPPAGHSLSIFVQTNLLVFDGDTGAAKELPTKDNDTFKFSDRLLKAQLEWRFLKQKGESWPASKEQADDVLIGDLTNDGAYPTLSLERQGTDFQPGIWIPAGSWNV